MDEYRIDLSNISGLAKDLYDFYELSGSYMGWLLTLSEEEFSRMSNSETMDKYVIAVYANKKYGGIVDEVDIARAVREIRDYTGIISLVKKGLIEVVDKNNNDGLWVVNTTEEGKKYLNIYNS